MTEINTCEECYLSICDECIKTKKIKDCTESDNYKHKWSFPRWVQQIGIDLHNSEDDSNDSNCSNDSNDAKDNSNENSNQSSNNNECDKKVQEISKDVKICPYFHLLKKIENVNNNDNNNNNGTSLGTSEYCYYCGSCDEIECFECDHCTDSKLFTCTSCSKIATFRSRLVKLLLRQLLKFIDFEKMEMARFVYKVEPLLTRYNLISDSKLLKIYQKYYSSSKQKILTSQLVKFPFERSNSYVSKNVS